MCLAVYVAADHELPESTFRPGLTHIWSEAVSRKACPRLLTKPHVYYVGAHEGCGCGFLTDGRDAQDDGLTRESLSAFSAYMELALNGGDVEVLACWEGEQDATPSSTATISPAYFSFENRPFDEASNQPVRLVVKPPGLNRPLIKTHDKR